jgi:hypothetical protein
MRFGVGLPLRKRGLPLNRKSLPLGQRLPLKRGMGNGDFGPRIAKGLDGVFGEDGPFGKNEVLEAVVSPGRWWRRNVKRNRRGVCFDGLGDSFAMTLSGWRDRVSGGLRWDVMLGVVDDVLERRFTKETNPGVGIEIREGRWIRCDSGKPVVVNDVELGGDVSCVGVKQRGGTGCMFGRQAHVHVSVGPGFPAREALAVGQAFFQNIDGTAPNVKVQKFLLFPAGFRENVCWRKTCL